MGWFSDVVDALSDVVSGATDVLGDITEASVDIVTGDIGGAISEAQEVFQQPVFSEVLSEFGLDEFAGEIGTALGTAIAGPAGGTIGGLIGQSFEFGAPEGRATLPLITRPRLAHPAAPTFLPTGATTMAYEDFGDGGEMVPTAGALGGAVAAGGIWLGTYLARAFGRGAASAVFTAANGIRVRINQLWPLVRQYGPQAVAGALGITLGGLGTLLAQAPTSGGGRKRRRGISARDVTITRRTIKQLRKLSRLAGIRTGRGGYAPRRRHRHYYYH